MKAFFPRIAAVNLASNKTAYLPYLLTSSVCVATFYIMLTFAISPEMARVPYATGAVMLFGFGTVINIVLCAVFIDALLWLGWVPQMSGTLSGVLMLLAGLELLVLGTWMYMKSALGAGPRDALMVALARRTGRSVGLCRISVEILVILTGYFLGGQVGIGTVISALGLGSLFNLNFHLLGFRAAELHQENIAETLRFIRQQKK